MSDLDKPMNQSAGALVLVNSASPCYREFQHTIQPYLDHFGVPYQIHDVAGSSAPANMQRYALIVIGHTEFDPQGACFGEIAQRDLISAVRNAGSGLVSFDGAIFIAGGKVRYHYAQDIFGCDFSGQSVPADSIQIYHSSPGDAVTALHEDGEVLWLFSKLQMPQVSPPQDAATLATAGEHPLLISRACGAGRAILWTSIRWADTSVRGPIFGLDDLVWRGLAWAARKPFVLRGMPPFVTMRVDDVSGWGQETGPTPLWWLESLRRHHLKPWLGLFIWEFSQQAVDELKPYVKAGDATAIVHGFTWHNFFYFDHWNKRPFPDHLIAEHARLADAWYNRHGDFPKSKVALGHFYEMGGNALSTVDRWGAEFLGTCVPIDEPHTYKPSNRTHYLQAGPFRKYEEPMLSNENRWPIYFADFVETPGRPEYDGKFFNVLTEIRDVAGYEWKPDNDVRGTIERGVAQLRRAFDSMALATLFTHDRDWIYHIRPENWEDGVAGVVDSIAGYDPIFITLDEGYGYARALATSQVTDAVWNPSSRVLELVCSGHSDRTTQVGVFLDEMLDRTWVEVPRFEGTISVKTDRLY